MAHQCPVCGYPKLAEPPRTPSGGASYEICPSCGFEFGVSDDDAGLTYEAWRGRWRAGGMRWAGRGSAAPRGWDPVRQLESLPSPASAGTRKRRRKPPG